MPLHIIREDITKMRVDAIVNTTNKNMKGYSGVDYAIHTAAGDMLDRECEKLVPLELGFAKITKGYALDCKYIIHTSGPVWRGGKFGEQALLKSCYVESLYLAKKYKCKSVAFPLISSGNYGYPKDMVLRYAIQIISEFLYENEMNVYICVFDRDPCELNRSLFSEITEFLIDTPLEEYEAADSSSNEPTAKPDTIFFQSNDIEFSSNCTAKSFVSTESAVNSKVKPKNTRQLRDYLKDMDKGFAATLFDYIDKSGMSDIECYKKANIDRRTFSKIKSNSHYKPSKQTAVAFSIALRLDLESTQHLLSTAGLTLSCSDIFDKIIRFFIINESYDIFEINEALFEFDQVLLGC